MDTSKKYIKMCRKAPEIQNYWEPKDGDYFYGKPDDMTGEDFPEDIYVFFNCEDEFYAILPQYYDPIKKRFKQDSTAVFLPRVDDLYQMILADTPTDLAEIFYKWTSSLTVQERERLNTMEKCWLAFVMSKNHHMIWTGRDWEKKLER